jgi:PadR family transcriptional regulator, regulatory protein PadR
MAPRMTIPTQRVLHVLLEDAGSEAYGYEIGEAAGLASGTVHPILARLEGAGWLESRWEDVDSSRAGRPARRYYKLTADGATAARESLAQVRQPRRVGLPGLWPEPEPS